jgi:hypothetical protein
MFVDRTDAGEQLRPLVLGILGDAQRCTIASLRSPSFQLRELP